MLLDEAIALDPQFAEAHRKRGVILNNLGRGSEAIEAFERALAHPERLTDYERYHTQGVAVMAAGDPTGAIAAYRALPELNSDDLRALNNLGVLDSQSVNPQWQSLGHRRLAELEALQGRIGRARREFDEAVRLSADRGAVRGAMLAGLRRSLVESLVLGDTVAAVATLARVRARHPLDGVADAPFLLWVAAYTAAGALDSARAALGRLRAQPDWLHRSNPTWLPAAEAGIAAAEGDHLAAAALWTQAIQKPDTCPICFLPQLGIALELGGRDSAAIAAYRGYLDTPHHSRAGSLEFPDGDALHRAFVQERLAGLYERRGDTIRAIEHHRALADLWKDADRELQPRVAAARRALARLASEGGG